MLQSFGADQSTISSVSSALGGTTTSVPSSGSSSAASGYVFNNYLSPGSTGPDVTALQNILIQEGYLSAAATGYYGSQTEAAVIAFQAARGIDQLGVVGPATRAALNALGGSSGSSSANTASGGDGYQFDNPLDVGSTGQDVTELQQRLTTLGLYNGPVTGYYGSETQAAVEAFQSEHGLEQLGNVGPATRAALNGQ